MTVRRRHTAGMSLPSPPARPSRLTGFAIVLCLVALLALPTGSAATGATTQGAALWQWPIRPTPVVTRPFEQPPTRYSAGHRGIDIAGDVGTPVYSPASGIVHFAGAVGGRPVLSLEHLGGVLSSFEPVDSVLVAGDTVAAGDVIGIVSGPSASHCDNCLHFGVREDGEYVSPLKFLGGIAPAVLLPTRKLPAVASSPLAPANNRSGARVGREVAVAQPFG